MTNAHESSDDRESVSRGKVARLLNEYDLQGLGAKLESLWTREEDRKSLRELAEYFNKSLVEQTLERESSSTLDGEAANYYRLLTGDVSSGTRIQAENRLEQHGVDVDQLRSNFVSRQAIHTYLTQERQATHETRSKTRKERIDDRLQTIQRLKTRVTTVVNSTISELSQAGLLSVGDTHTTVLVRIDCQSCNNQYSVSELLTNGGCQCREDDDQ